jgi:hypothetical protein
MFPSAPFFPLHKPHPKLKFTEAEDQRLTRIVGELGHDDWDMVAQHLPGRNARQCRDRWLNYLSPDVTNGPWTAADEALLVEKYNEFGATWKHIATFFPTRTDINVKSRWQLMQRRALKRASRGLLRAGPRPAMGAEPLPLPLAQPGAERAEPPPNREASEPDIWATLLLNDDTGMGGMFDHWF